MEEIKIILNEEKNGIELYFNDKPTEEIRDNLKAHSFRWAKYNKCWYAKQSEENISFANSLANIDTEELKKNSDAYKEEKEKETERKLAEIDINDIEEYTVSAELSKRENENGFFRNKDRDHTAEIQRTLQNANNEVLKVLENNNDLFIEYNLKTALQRFKRDYFSNYIAELTHRANNPSWVITGRSGRNARRDEKMNNRYDNLMKKSNELIDNFNKQLKRAEDQIRKNKIAAAQEKFNNAEIKLDSYTFKRIKKDFNVNATNYIFSNVNSKNKSMVTLNNEYFIFKNWGSYRVYNAAGKELYSAKTKGTLEDAKKWIIYYLENK